MLIGIDGNEANIERRAGVNRYAHEILKGLYKLQGEGGIDHSFLIYLKEKPLGDLPKEREKWEYKILKAKKLWIITKLMPHLLLTKRKPDILFSPSHYTVPVSVIHRVCAIMDLGYLNFSGQFKKTTYWQLKYWTAISIIISKRIIAISNTTKEDIVRQYPFASKKISVTHLAYDRDVYNMSIKEKDVRRIKDKYSIVDDYVLYLGTLKPSKNIEGIINAFAILRETNNKVKLVIAGKKGWMYKDIYKLVEKLHLKDQIIFTDFFDDKDQPALYKGARLLVSPSFWEGFGIHVIESMACGTPVVISKSGSLYEVAGDAAIYVDHSPKSIAKGMLDVLKMDETRYNKQVEMGLKKAKEYSWGKTTKKTLEILTKLY